MEVVYLYNRYTPGTNGVYQRQTIRDAECRTAELPERVTEKPPAPAIPVSCQTNSKTKTMSGMDLGDLLLLCIVLLLSLDSGEEDLQSLLITAAAFLFLS